MTKPRNRPGWIVRACVSGWVPRFEKIGSSSGDQSSAPGVLLSAINLVREAECTAGDGVVVVEAGPVEVQHGSLPWILEAASQATATQVMTGPDGLEPV